jgi:cation:H+ antiporter
LDLTIAVIVCVSSGAVVVAAGVAMTRTADAIAEITGIGRLWLGAALLAAATSLPELATDVAAVLLEAPDLAAGDLFGSSLANMLILALIGLAAPRARALAQATLDHALLACLAISLNALAGALVLLAWPLALAGVSPGSLLLALGFLAGMRVVHRQDASARERAAVERVEARRRDSGRRALRSAAGRFAAAAAITLAAAPAFAWSAEAIALGTGLGTTFVGTWLVGLATSLPELVSCFAAVRLGSAELAIGNLFGSNAFNMAIFLALDLVHPGASIFAALSPAHVPSALFAVVSMSLGLAAIVYRAERRFWMIEPDSALMILVYLAAVWVGWTRAGAP